MAAQFTFVAGKEYKVVNWIDGLIHISTFSKTGKETVVRSEKTRAAVLAQLVKEAHEEAIELDSPMDQESFNNASSALRGVWVNLNHAEALKMNAELDAEYESIARNVPADADHSRFRAIARYYITGSGLRPLPSATFQGMVTDEHGETLAQFGNVVV